MTSRVTHNTIFSDSSKTNFALLIRMLNYEFLQKCISNSALDLVLVSPLHERMQIPKTNLLSNALAIRKYTPFRFLTKNTDAKI